MENNFFGRLKKISYREFGFCFRFVHVSKKILQDVSLPFSILIVSSLQFQNLSNKLFQSEHVIWKTVFGAQSISIPLGCLNSEGWHPKERSFHVQKHIVHNITLHNDMFFKVFRKLYIERKVFSVIGKTEINPFVRWSRSNFVIYFIYIKKSIGYSISLVSWNGI